jgi:hypothetical protein
VPKNKIAAATRKSTPPSRLYLDMLCSSCYTLSAHSGAFGTGGCVGVLSSMTNRPRQHV